MFVIKSTTVETVGGGYISFVPTPEGGTNFLHSHFEFFLFVLVVPPDVRPSGGVGLTSDA
jgi:hypothetical protein